MGQFLQALLSVIVVLLPGVAHEELGNRIEHAKLSRAMSESLIVPSSRRRKPYHWGFCHKAPGGCRARLNAFAQDFINAGRTYQLPVWLLAAMAYKESRFNPAANGRAREFGILQILPNYRKGVPFFLDPEGCLLRVGACQSEVIDRAAFILRNSLEKCGSLSGALSRYNSGRCESEAGAKYARHVARCLRMLEDLSAGNLGWNDNCTKTNI